MPNFNNDELKFTAGLDVDRTYNNLSEASVDNLLGGFQWAFDKNLNLDIAFVFLSRTLSEEQTRLVASKIHRNKAKIVSRSNGALVIKTKEGKTITAHFLGRIGVNFTLPGFEEDSASELDSDETSVPTPKVAKRPRRAVIKRRGTPKPGKATVTIRPTMSVSPKRKCIEFSPLGDSTAKEPPKKKSTATKSLRLSSSSESSFEDARNQGATQELF